MNRFINSKAGKIDCDEFRQLIRQAGNQKLCESVVNVSLINCNSRRFFFTDEMQRHIHADLFIGGNTLEIDVQNLWFVRMHLERTKQDTFGLAIKNHFKNGSMEFFLAESVENFVVIKFDRGSSNLTTVDDARKLFRTAKAAARTRTLRFTCDSSEFHLNKLQK